MNTSVVLTFSEEELFELERIILDDDRDGALRALKKYLERPVKTAISGEGR